MNEQVQVTNIIGTRLVVCTAWEPKIDRQHSTITTIGGNWYGAVNSRFDEDKFAHLGSWTDERVEQVTAYQTEQKDRAYRIIEKRINFPDDLPVRKRSGEIEIIFPDEASAREYAAKY